MSEEQLRDSGDRSEEMANQVGMLQEQLQEAMNVVLEQEDELARLNATPLVYATVLSSTHEVKPERFERGDKVLVIAEECGSYRGRIGSIVSDGVDLESGTVRCEFHGIRQKPHFKVGLPTVINPETDKPYEPQVHLLVKNDGSNIVIVLDGKVQEVWNTHRLDPSPGDIAKCNLKSNQVMEITASLDCGDVCNVVETKVAGENKLEVETGGNKRVVFCYHEDVEVGDKVILDPNGIVVVKHISNENTKKFKLTAEVTVSWDQIGGQAEAKEEMQEAIIWPHKNPDMFAFYNRKMPAGFLLYGPPGCGKTLIGKATAATLAEMHGAQAVQSGFNYVKGPEILSMWVGESEAQSRAIFQRMRKHYEMHGYPCVTFVDEADAIFTERGSSHGQKWHDTLVAMWLAEMDGFDRKGGMLIFATNRPKALDGAVVREGRIDSHIKVPRPTRDAAADIVKIHLNGTPLVSKTEPEQVVQVVVEELFDNTRPLYQVQDPSQNGRCELFSLVDCVSGSMIAAVIETAKSMAIRRDMEANRKRGCKRDDFRNAIEQIFQRHQSLNHKFDLMDFCEVRGMNEKAVKVDRIHEQPVQGQG
jgi:proteasome ATPase